MMNVRFSDQHIRFRVNRAELDQLISGRRLALNVPMPRAHKFHASINVTQMGDWQLDSDPTGLWLSIPRTAIESLASDKPSKEGLVHDFDLGQGQHLSVGFEVDLKASRQQAA
jgi:hypothetical protein